MNLRYTFTLVTHLLCTALFLQVLNYTFPNCTSWIHSWISTCILWICTAAFTFRFTKRKFLGEKIQADNRAVFITGCDSGFGHRIAKRFDSKGYLVFATCLFPSGSGASELKKSCSERLHVLHMDVTQDDSVKKAFDYVKENLGTSKLWAIVNNAGNLKGFSVEMSDIKDFRDCLEVNTLGPVRVIKAFLPLLKQSKGRIVNITSTAGVNAFPFFTPYTTSKFAAVGLTECLRQELNMWGISVISIEPESFKTGLSDIRITDEKLDSGLQALDCSVKHDYGEKFFNSFRRNKNFLLNIAAQQLSPVVDDVESAVTLVCPDYTYKSRRNSFARFIIFCYEQFPRSFQFLFIVSLIDVFFPKPDGMKND